MYLRSTHLLCSTSAFLKEQAISKSDCEKRPYAGLLRWEGKNENEVGRCRETGKIHVTVNHKYYRPTEVVSKGILTALPRNASHSVTRLLYLGSC
ncbi:hypothetical protein lerEdw1_007196 [Lerista edwardsae]|nr:hypothetical protein lerEdw1_007196 [Lerista edwardsae]